MTLPSFPADPARATLLALGVLAAACGLGLAPAHADEADGPVIIVTGVGLGDTPATPAYDVRDIGRDSIGTSASGRIEDVLASVAGFQQFRRSDSRSSNPSAQGVTLRALGGNATSRALVLLDGVPMADPFFGYIPLSALAPERLGRVRVTRGGGAGAFGAGAVAGTIELTSADAATLGALAASALVNDRGESEVSASLAPSLGRGFAVVGGRWDRGRGFWTTPVGQRVPASVRAGFESWSAALRGVAPIGDTVEMQARVMAFDDSRVLRFAGARTTSSGQDASLRLVGRGDWQFDALAYVQARDFSNVVISSSTFRRTLDQSSTPSTGMGGKIELRPPVGGDHVLRLGGDLRIADGRMREEPYAGNPAIVTARRGVGGRNSDLGFYVEDDWTLGDMVLTLGGRADRWTVRDGYFRETTPAGVVTSETRFADRAGWSASLRGGAVWRVGGGMALRGVGYSGLRLPTLNELYRPFVVFPVRTQANAALRNEQLRGFEAGVDFAPSDAISLSLTAFDNRLKHAIANVTLAPDLRERRNVDAIRARGLEATAELRWGDVTFDGSLAFTDAELRASGDSAGLDGMRPAQAPKIAASGRIAWQPRPGWHVTATVRHVGAQFEDDLETDVLRAATTLDAYAEVPLHRGVSLVLRGENLTDTHIVTRNQGGSIDLGTPRTLWAGVRFGLR